MNLNPPITEHSIRQGYSRNFNDLSGDYEQDEDRTQEFNEWLIAQEYRIREDEGRAIMHNLKVTRPQMDDQLADQKLYRWGFTDAWHVALRNLAWFIDGRYKEDS